MENKSFSAISNAALRAMDSFYPEKDRLFNDKIAYKLLPPLWKLFVWFMKISFLREMIYKIRNKQMPGVIANLIYRTKYIDDLLNENLKQNIEQVLILGSGFDTRAYRFKSEKVIYFEVDHPDTMKLKKERVKKHLDKQIDQVEFIAVDFEKNEMKEIIDKSSFNKKKKTLVIWEGVTQYINAEAVDNVFDYVSTFQSGSKIIFTYIKKGVIDGTESTELDEKILSYTEEKGSTWIFGIDEEKIADYVKKRGFFLKGDVGADYYYQRYSKLIERDLKSYHGERTAYAQLRKN